MESVTCFIWPLFYRLFALLIVSNQYVFAQLNLPIFDFIYQRSNNFSDSIRDTNLFYKEYDFVVIGSGSGGSVVANRLTEIDGFTVLLLEAGGEENFISDVPLTPSATQLTSKVFLEYNFKLTVHSQDKFICPYSRKHRAHLLEIYTYMCANRLVVKVVFERIMNNDQESQELHLIVKLSI